MSDSALIDVHKIQIDVYLSDLDPSALYKRSLDLNLVIEISLDAEQIITFRNSAPQVESLQGHIIVFVGTSSLQNVGLPFDMLQDVLYVSEWVLDNGDTDSDSDKPEWIRFINQTISEGLMFEFTPKENQAD